MKKILVIKPSLVGHSVKQLIYPLGLVECDLSKIQVSEYQYYQDLGFEVFDESYELIEKEFTPKSVGKIKK